MSEAEVRQRVYNLIVFLREEKGMSYEEIEQFWKDCIKEAKRREAKKK